MKKKRTAAGLPGNRHSPLFRCAGPALLPLLFYASLAPEAGGQSAAKSSAAPFDVVHYDAQVEPDIANKMVTGKVLIRLIVRTDNPSAVEFDCGDLAIDSVREGGREQKFVRQDRRLGVSLLPPPKAGEKREIEIEYHGAPRSGIRFFPEQAQVYTVFSTSRWMVCVDAPDDKATLRLNLILPRDLSAVANGRLAARRDLPNDKVVYEWRQETPVPTYTFGFAAGRFRTLTEKRGRVELRYLATQYSDEELRRIFRNTADMISFYEERAGVRYADATYTQVLAAGGVEQEMSSFTALRESYGREVLGDERAIWLGAHELAHQWWGNMVTCRDWTHFWLNEGMATFMAAAYKEHRFGREEYLREIERSRAIYQKVRGAGKDKSLAFPDWLHPTPEDRRLVYDKGALVLHLLREELGERAFWAGIRHYTRTYFGKSVVTDDFKKAMEQASGRDLTDFFSRWVYLTRQ
ncbi:MAG TPA: M1 family metallopeptidase [Blastocatellia bacterium]|nr:M1 family metallopeptidase [Blastocatellia bacterium]